MLRLVRAIAASAAATAKLTWPPLLYAQNLLITHPDTDGLERARSPELRQLAS